MAGDIIEVSAGVSQNSFAWRDIQSESRVDGGSQADEDLVENEERIVLRLDPRLAPVKAAVYPLLRKGGQPEKAQEVLRMLKRHFAVAYDHAGSIGRRYRRQDEVGTPFGITIDHQTMEDDTVTLRDRDSTEQVRFKIAALAVELTERVGWHR